MLTPSRLLSFTLVTALFILGGCAASQFGPGTVIDAASNTPDHFLVGLPTGPETMEPVPGEGCRNPMVDPRDSTRLTLVRSSETQGDYAVPDGRYGVGRGELLRLDCGTGRAVGIVRR